MENKKEYGDNGEKNLPSTEVVTMDLTSGIVPHDYKELIQFSKLVHASGLAPKSFDSPEKIAIGILTNMELGRPTITGLQDLAVINGKCGIYGDATTAMITASGLMEPGYPKEEESGTPYQDDWTFKYTVKRKGQEERTGIWTWIDSKRAGFDNPTTRDGRPDKWSPWTRFTRRMMQWKARHFVNNDVFGDILKGMKTVEQLHDFDAIPMEETGPGSFTVEGTEKEDLAGKINAEPLDIETKKADATNGVASEERKDPHTISTGKGEPMSEADIDMGKANDGSQLPPNLDPENDENTMDVFTTEQPEIDPLTSHTEYEIMDIESRLVDDYCTKNGYSQVARMKESDILNGRSTIPKVKGWTDIVILRYTPAVEEGQAPEYILILAAKNKGVDDKNTGPRDPDPPTADPDFQNKTKNDDDDDPGEVEIEFNSAIAQHAAKKGWNHKKFKALVGEYLEHIAEQTESAIEDRIYSAVRKVGMGKWFAYVEIWMKKEYPDIDLADGGESGVDENDPTVYDSYKYIRTAASALTHYNDHIEAFKASPKNDKAFREWWAGKAKLKPDFDKTKLPVLDMPEAGGIQGPPVQDKTAREQIGELWVKDQKGVERAAMDLGMGQWPTSEEGYKRLIEQHNKNVSEK